MNGRRAKLLLKYAEAEALQQWVRLNNRRSKSQKDTIELLYMRYRLYRHFKMIRLGSQRVPHPRPGKQKGPQGTRSWMKAYHKRRRHEEAIHGGLVAG